MNTRREFIGGLTAAVSLAGWRTWAAEEGLPAYYGDHLAEVTAKVRLNAKKCCDAFWFITDPHVKMNHCRSGRILAELVRRTGIRRVLCGGDVPMAFGTKEREIDFPIDRFRECWVKPIRAAGGLLYTAKGNHDFTIRRSPRKEDETHGFTYSGKEARDIIVGEWTERDVVCNSEDPSGSYYYFDDPQSRIRYVVADTTDSERAGEVAWGVAYGVHDRQLSWLAGNAFGTVPSGYDIVVMHHIPITGVVGSASEEKRFKNLRMLLEAYQNRGSVTVGGKAYDFSESKGRILLDLTGHEHAERQTFQMGVWHVTEPCDANCDDYVPGSAPWCGTLPRKDAGTIYEQTFDMVQISRDHRSIYFTRVGGGQDRVIHLDPIRVKVGERRRIVPKMLSGPITFGCYDGDRVTFRVNPKNRYQSFVEYGNDLATMSGSGEFVALKPGPSVVVMRNARLDKELLPVKIV